MAEVVPMELLPLAVSDVRQHVYCPRIPYYRLGLRLHRPTTFKMEEGKREHTHVGELEERRSLRAYGLTEGERLFGVQIHSQRLGLAGKLDMLIRTPYELIPVEFKNSEAGLGLNQKYQAAAYALLVEERYHRPVHRAFVYFVPLKRAKEVAITSGARRYVHRVLGEIRDSVAREHMPEGTRVLGRCRECEFLNFCNDRW